MYNYPMKSLFKTWFQNIRWPRLLMAGLVCFSLQNNAFASSYVVGPGDELYVDFPLKGAVGDLQPLGGNGLTLVVVGNQVFFRYIASVAPDGFISLPTMKPLRVSGLTIEQIREMIILNMKSFTLKDDVSVLMGRPNSQAFFISGEVKNPGRFIFERPTTLTEAITIAGGPTDHSKLKKVLLLRSGQPPQKIDLSYKQLEENGVPTIALQPSDLVVVPRRWFTPDNTLAFFILSALGTSVAVYAATR